MEPTTHSPDHATGSDVEPSAPGLGPTRQQVARSLRTPRTDEERPDSEAPPRRSETEAAERCTDLTRVLAERQIDRLTR